MPTPTRTTVLFLGLVVVGGIAPEGTAQPQPVERLPFPAEPPPGRQSLMPQFGPAEWQPVLHEQFWAGHGEDRCLLRGFGTLQYMGSFYFTSSLGPDVTKIDFAPNAFRLGRILNWPRGEGFFRGNLEPMIEVNAAPIFRGPGNILVGPSLFLRYNFVPQESRLIPYIQTGAGFVYNDAYKDPTQDALGQAIEFYLQAQVGLKWFWRPNISLDIEGGFSHISNANMASRNLGINALGGGLGITWYFGAYCPR